MKPKEKKALFRILVDKEDCKFYIGEYPIKDSDEVYSICLRKIGIEDEQIVWEFDRCKGVCEKWTPRKK